MTNYQAIIQMNLDWMESFLDQVYLVGLNTGMHAAGLPEEEQDELLDYSPFDASWLVADADSALVSDDDEYLISPLVEAIVRILGIDSWEPGMEDVFDDILGPCEDCDATEVQEESGWQAKAEGRWEGHKI